MALVRFSIILLALYAGGVTVYLVALTFAACRFKKKVRLDADPMRIGILIPAHDEEGQIGAAIQGVRLTRYSPALYEIWVIADNCSDGTAGKASETGARVFERADPTNPGKGQALDWFLNGHREVYGAVDAVVVMDADTVMGVDFLDEAARSLSVTGIDVVQGYYGVSNPEASWRTALMTAALCVFHHLRPAGRNRLGATAGLKGNGMAFRTEILSRYGWPAHSVVEDVEFGVKLLLDGIKVHYNPDAVVYGEMAESGRQAESQRRRWEGGRVAVLRRYGLPLARKFIVRLEFCYLDCLLDLITPPLSLLVLMVGALCLFGLLFLPGVLPFALLALAGLAFYVFAGLLQKKVSWRVWGYLATTPFYIAWKLPLYWKLLRGSGDVRWTRTERVNKSE